MQLFTFLSGVNRMITKEYKSIVESRINQATNVMIPKQEKFSPEVIFLLDRKKDFQEAVAVYHQSSGVNFINTSYERLSEEAWNFSESFLEDDFNVVASQGSSHDEEIFQKLKSKYLKLLNEWS